MKHTNTLPKVFGVVAIALLLQLALRSEAKAQFFEDFSSPTLNAAWEVRAYTGPFPRSHGLISPANHHSLIDNPGHLCYFLDPMTHGDGYLNNYQTTFGFHSCCNHDAGLELHRTFSGDHWLFEAKADYFMPFANGRDLDVCIYFGDGGANTFSVFFIRFRDVNQNWLRVRLAENVGPGPYRWGGTALEEVTENFDLFGPSNTSFYFRLERSQNVLTAAWSADGANWNTGFTRDMGNQLDGLEQRVVVTGASWFVPAGSYADYDYISVTPTVKTVAIDIKPSSDPNSINCEKENGTIPVAILSTEDFDARTVDHTTVRFGKDGTEAAEIHTNKKSGEARRHEEDVDGDGDLDLVFHFRFGATGLQCGDGEAVLTGETFDGQKIEGRDAIRTVEAGAAKSVAVQDEAGLPASFTLFQNYPNPFNPETEIRFALPRASHVMLRIYNTLGQEIRTLVDSDYPPGLHSVSWDGKDASGKDVTSGVYLYRIQAGKFSKVMKMSLIR
ncbi:MAG: FlgD immunoglobulin-like domain containing protein [bacterium]